MPTKWIGFGPLFATVLFVGASLPAAADGSHSWPMFGQNTRNTANQASESKISAGNVSQLQKKWAFTTGGDVSARAAVVEGVAYFPDWGGNLWAVRAKTGTKVWGHQLSDYGLPAGTHSRTTPAVIEGVVYIGTQEGAWLLAIDAESGTLIWKTQLEPADPLAIISASPVVSGSTLFTGVASTEEAAAGFVPGFVCCSARGSVVAVNVNTGKVKWKTYTTPEGYAGAGVWGSNMVVSDGLVYAGTGNNSAHAKDSAQSSDPTKTYGQCIAAGGTVASCSSPDNHVDSILALNVGNGKVVWASKLVTWNQFYAVDGSDDWNVGCFTGSPNCPSNPGPDYDFGSAPNLITYTDSSGKKQTILGAGQKSGVYYALNPKTGSTLWQKQVGPGSSLGGMEWGSASDGKRIYVQIANFYGLPSGAGSAGSWAALDPATGAVLWMVSDPNGAPDLGPMTVANGVVYASSMGGAPTMPTMLALDAGTGSTLWSFQAGSSVNAGATVVNGMVFWGSGYAHLGIPGQTGNNLFYAFTLGGN